MGERKYFLDWLRVSAFGFLILFHCGMLYVSWPYNTKSPRLVPEIEPLMNALGAFRLALLFFISGVASRFLIARLGAGRFALDRVRRLLPVILFGMFVVIPPQSFIELVSKGVWHGDYLSFWFTQYLPADQTLVRPLHKTMPTWDHLWFVVYLFFYTLGFAVIFAIVKRGQPSFLRRRTIASPPPCGEVGTRSVPGGGGLLSTEPPPGNPSRYARRISDLPTRGRCDEGEYRIPVVVLLVAPAFWLAAANLLIRYRYPLTDALIGDWGAHLKWIGMFALGITCAGHGAFWDTLRRYRLTFLAVAVALLAIQSFVNDPYWSIVNGLYAWTVICALAGYAMTHMNRPSAALSHLNEAVLPIYVLHQPILLFAAFYFFPLRLPLPAEALAIAAITAVGCFLIYEAAIRPFAIMRFLFGLKPKSAPTRRAVAVSST